MSEGIIAVEVAYALPERQKLVALQLPESATVSAAIDASTVLKDFPDIPKQGLTVGIFGNVCPMTHVLKSGDRVEIYRPLVYDPKEARRQRAAK